MPTHPPRPDDDDAYIVDTRRGPARGPRRPGVGPGVGPGSGSGAGGPSQAGDDAFVVDTRRSRPAATRLGGGAAGRGPGPDEEWDDAPPPRRRRGRRVLLIVGLLILAWLAFLVWVPLSAWGKVQRVDNIPAGDRPADTPGHTYLLVGSDSRAGLTKAERKLLKTGNALGKRTDTIMLVHVPDSGGKPAIISIPRDSYVPIPGKGSSKINAAFAWGGAKLLTETVERATGLHMDGYVEIGFGGFNSIVDSLGGVDICVPRNMKDAKAGINLKKGCQVLNGPQALGYVRSRYEDPLGDIGRANRQRQFLGALMKKAATPGTILVPWRFKSFADASAGGLVVGEQTGLMDAIRVLQAMRAVSNGDGLSLTVPIATTNYQTANAGVAVKWDTERAKALFKALKNDEPLTSPPPGTTTGK